MTAPQLLGYIVTALLLQLLAAIGLVVWRRRGQTERPSARVAEVAPSNAAWPGWREFRVTRRAFEDASRSQCSFYLQPVDGAPLPPYLPGQFLTFSLALEAGGHEVSAQPPVVTRCYSLSDRPEPTGYRVTIKRVLAPLGRPELAPGLASGYFHDHLREGDVLRVKPPAGHFFIDPDSDVPAVLIAGGIGITPMMSILRWCVSEQPGRTLHLFYGVRNSREQAFKQGLERLAAEQPTFHLNVIYSKPLAHDLLGRDFQFTGHLDVDLLRRTLPHGRHQFYVCGPSAMMESLVPGLLEWGVPPQDIHFEAFGPASISLPGSQPAEESASLPGPVEVQFLRSGRTLMWDGQDANLLDFAERHDLLPDAGCRSGACGTCETRLVSGEVRYASKPDHDVAPGHCLLCVGRPDSALVLEA